MSSWLTYSLLCLIVWGLWGFAIKYAYKGLDWINVYFLSSLASFTLALTVYLLATRGVVPRIETPAYYALLSGLLGGLGYIFFVKALEKGKASVVVPLTALYPAITVILSLVLLGEKPSMYQLIGVILAIVAAILISIE
ncbi:MAG: EamA family transporter [Thermoprotei archaeon]